MMRPVANDWQQLAVSPDAYPWYIDVHILAAAASSSATWPTANLALYWPFMLRTGITAQKAFVANGAAVSGNFDIGIYSEGGSQLWHSGSTAQSGTTTIQAVTISGGQYLARGRYWMGLAFDNTTATVRRWTGVTNLGNISKFMGMGQQATAFALPATATFAACANSFLPHYGLYLLTLTM